MAYTAQAFTYQRLLLALSLRLVCLVIYLIGTCVCLIIIWQDEVALGMLHWMTLLTGDVLSATEALEGSVKVLGEVLAEEGTFSADMMYQALNLFFHYYQSSRGQPY